MNAIVLFNKDLRVEDHLPFYQAVKEGFTVLPVYIFNPDDYSNFSEGFPKMGPQKAKFVFESVMDLKMKIEQLGGVLYIETGQVKPCIQQLVEAHNIETIFCTSGVTYDEQLFYRQLEGVTSIKTFENHSLLFSDDLPFPLYKLPKVFTPFRKKVEEKLVIRKPLSIPENISFLHVSATQPDLSFIENLIADPDKRTAFPFQGGATTGLKRLQSYVWETQNIKTYKETRNGLIGADYSSKFSPYLAWGCISARTIYSEIKAFEQQYGANDSTYWLFFELLWRDFFYFDALKKGNAFFRVSHNYIGKVNKGFTMWQTATTKDAFVNAAMREIRATGYMSNRMRQNVASYLIHDLKADWYTGARYFESLLIDYDPASNYGNWTYLAGIGNDPRNNRKFNTQKQADQYDPDGSYRNLWCE
ncbi:MAG: DASH family cryptochrome [Schleiferiaceae bacterium]|nr:DASH family cryptochrome [Schleiferiaceae bacterium]